MPYFQILYKAGIKRKTSALNKIVHIFMKLKTKSVPEGQWFPPRKLSVQSRCFIDDSWSAAHPPQALSIPYWNPLCLFLILPSLPSTQRPSCAIAVSWSFPTATDLVLTGDQFTLLLVTANVSVILPAKSLAPPKGTRCTQVSPGMTGPVGSLT